MKLTKPYLKTTHNFENIICAIEICHILRNKAAVLLVKNLIKKHYSNFNLNEKYASIIDKTFDELEKGQIERISFNNLKSSLTNISNHLYSMDNFPSFFNEYKIYKSFLKSEYYFNEIKNDILGKKLLDYGTGKGYFSEYLVGKKFKTTSTDILDYREVKNKEIEFVKISDSNQISSKIPKQDTSIMITVLHHINEDQILNTLNEISKITKRLIIIEDIYDTNYIMKNNISQNEKEILKISEKSKLDAIKLMDFYGNIVTQGLAKMNLPFQFKNINKWEDILNKSGFKVIKVDYIGIPKVSFHGFFQAKIICDSFNS